MRKLLGGFTALVLAALYAPIAVMMLFSFNESKYSVRWTGFTLDWYRKLAGDSTLHHELGNTLILAATTDHYEVANRGDEMSFTILKQTRRVLADRR